MTLDTTRADTREATDAFLSDGYLADNTPRAQRLSVAIYRLLAKAEPVSIADLSDALGWPEADVRALLGSFPASVLDRDARDRIVAFIGLSLTPSAHSFELDGHRLYTWCVLDALFLPEILGKAAVLATRCPATGAPLRVALAPDRIVEASPESAVMSVVAPDAGRCRDDLRGAFCNHVSLFSGPDAFAVWAADRAGVASVSLAEAHAMGRRRNAARFADIRLDRAAPSAPSKQSGGRS